MRIGFISEADPALPDSFSGIPFSMRRQLEQKAEVVSFTPRSAEKTLRRILAAAGLVRPVARLHQLLKPRPRPRAQVVDPMRSEQIEASILERASRVSRQIAGQVQRANVDVVFVCYSSPLLYELSVDVPIVYYSDSTGRTISAAYPTWHGKSDGYRNAHEEFNRRALLGSDAVALSTREAQASAIEDYDVDPDRAYVVPLGCNVTAAPDHERMEKRPSRSSYELCIVALDPARKGLDLAIDTVETMRDRGVEAWLTHVGPVTERARACPWVRCTGRLQLASPRDRAEHRRVLTESHFFIMPSLGGAFGIAPAEAGHHGTPSIVRAVGGLPEVVLDGDTGLVMPVEAGAEAYAEKLIELIDDPERYEQMCARAEHRARHELTWDAWRERIFPILESVIAHPAASVREPSGVSAVTRVRRTQR
jgi:glycosyltransferase involved in cell wall biosynthesis